MPKGEYQGEEIYLPYTQYKFKETSKKYYRPREKHFIGLKMKFCLPITLMLNLNRITHEPFDEQELFDALLKEYDKDREIIKSNKSKKEEHKIKPYHLDTYCRNHPLIRKHFLYVGHAVHIEDADGYLDADKKAENEFFNKYWSKKGIVRPMSEKQCKCTYDPIEVNCFIFNPFNYRLLVIGSECIKKFRILPRCKDCDDTITEKRAVECDMLCKNCVPYLCQVCKFQIDRTIKSRVCAECSELGRKRFKYGHYYGQSYMTVFKKDEKIVLDMRTKPSTFLGKFQERIDMYV